MLTRLATARGLESLYALVLWSVAGLAVAVGLAASAGSSGVGFGPLSARASLAALGVYAVYLGSYTAHAALDRGHAPGMRDTLALCALDVVAGVVLFYLLGASAGPGFPLRLLIVLPTTVRLPLRWTFAFAMVVAIAVAASPFLPPYSSLEEYASLRTPPMVGFNVTSVVISAVVFHAIARLVASREVLLREREALLAAERAARADAERRAAELEMLLDVARGISGELAQDAVMEEVHRQLVRVVPFDTCFIALRDPQHPERPPKFALVTEDGQRQTRQEGVVATKPDLTPTSYLSHVLAGGEPLLVLRSERELAALRATADVRGRIGDVSRPSASLLYAPLRSGTEVWGVLSVQSYEPNRYTARHLALLEMVARQAGIALQKAHLVSRVGEADALRTLARLKDELLATVSHELRTPLTYIYGFSEVLSTTAGATPNVQRIAGQIHEAAGHMRRILDDALDLERLQAGQLSLTPEPLDVHQAIDAALALLSGRLGDRQVSLLLEPDLPAVKADRHRVVQVLVNLLENALRYSDPATPLEMGAASHGGSAVLIWVKDQGVGLTDEQRNRIFEKFYRGPIEITGRHPGAGLGLSICRALVEAHGQGHHIWAESEGLGRGSCFRFTLPASLDDDGGESEPAQSSGSVTVRDSSAAR